MRHAIGIGMVAVALTLAGCGPLLAGDLTLAGGLTFAGKSLSYDVAASYPLLLSPVVINGKLLYSPAVDELAVAASTPVATLTDPLGCWLGWMPSPWVEDLTRKVEVGLAVWQTDDDFPVRGGLFWQVDILDWDF